MDTVITSHNVIVGLDEAGVDIDDIASLQRRASNNSWVVTFRSKAVRDAAMNEQSIKVAGCHVLLGDCENRVSIVKIYELPDELPDSLVIGRLSHYGHVISFRRDRKNIYRAAHLGTGLHCERILSTFVSFAAEDLQKMRRRRSSCGRMSVATLL